MKCFKEELERIASDIGLKITKIENVDKLFSEGKIKKFILGTSNRKGRFVIIKDDNMDFFLLYPTLVYNLECDLDEIIYHEIENDKNDELEEIMLEYMNDESIDWSIK